jgi:uncharacterized protein (UPF0147 family)
MPQLYHFYPFPTIFLEEPIYYDVEPEFTHNIEILLKELKRFTEIPANIKKAAQLTNYTVQKCIP